MGYPFDSLVPSYATTLGASADRPAALAELMGILVNGGVRKPVERIDSLHFAKDTPYETLVKRANGSTGERVLAPEVARAAVDAIRGVVSDGTAKRAKTAFVQADGKVIALGGKTGTGDQRFDVYAPGGRLVESRYVNRSATFVFNIGERFFGTMTAYVHGPESANYDFTSALPVQLLVTLAPSLMPMIDPNTPATVVAQAPAAGAPAGQVQAAASTAGAVAAPPAVATSADQATMKAAATANVAAAPAAGQHGAAQPQAPQAAAPAGRKSNLVVVDEKSLDAAAAASKAPAAAAKSAPKADATSAGSQAAAAKHPASATDADPARATATKRPVRLREPAKDAEQPPRAKDPAKQGALQNQLF
jgi:membrane peptidoglycan carboxypeptidase